MRAIYRVFRKRDGKSYIGQTRGITSIYMLDLTTSNILFLVKANEEMK